MRSRRRKGSDRLLRSHGTPLYDEHGEVYAVLATSYDISDRKWVEDERNQVELALRASEARLQQVPAIETVGAIFFNMLMQQVRTLPAEQGGQVKAIVLTAYAGDFNQQQAWQAGFQQHVSKPVEPEALVKAIQAVLTG
jgi:DNA-binding NtrC family response regulator